MHPDYLIRAGRQQDIPEVFELVKALALFERSSHEVSNTWEKMLEDGFGPDPIYHLSVAEYKPGKKVVGMALYFVAYSTWKGRLLYLDDLMVDENHRRKGLASALLQAYFNSAEKLNCQHFRWQVLDWNSDAIALYSQFPVKFSEEWINCNLRLHDLKLNTTTA